MTQFENLLYLSVGIVCSISDQTSVDIDFQQVRRPIVAPIEKLYSQDYSPSNASVYTIKDFSETPKRSYMLRYKAIAESSWYEKAYKGKSLGDFIEVDN